MLFRTTLSALYAFWHVWQPSLFCLFLYLLPPVATHILCLPKCRFVPHLLLYIIASGAVSILWNHYLLLAGVRFLYELLFSMEAVEGICGICTVYTLFCNTRATFAWDGGLRIC